MYINIWMAAGGLNVTQASRKVLWSERARDVNRCTSAGPKQPLPSLSQPFVFAVFVLLFGVFGPGGTTPVLL